MMSAITVRFVYFNTDTDYSSQLLTTQSTGERLDLWKRNTDMWLQSLFENFEVILTCKTLEI